VPFSYYSRLSPRQQAIYRKSDAVTSIPVPGGAALRPEVDALEDALRRDDGESVARSSFRICAGISRALGVRAPDLEILAVRPRADWGELHGLYTPDGEQPARIRVWMRTAAHARVVAFRTYLRTLLHELCHHLDLALFDLAWSYHTEGFFKRESSLFRQLVPRDAEPRERAGEPSTPRNPSRTGTPRRRASSPGSRRGPRTP
jgi:hypothetical protein